MGFIHLPTGTRLAFLKRTAAYEESMLDVWSGWPLGLGELTLGCFFVWGTQVTNGQQQKAGFSWFP